eukprot:12813555-Alexandrium_andersonii.AAC.1
MPQGSGKAQAEGSTKGCAALEGEKAARYNLMSGLWVGMHRNTMPGHRYTVYVHMWLKSCRT